MSDHIRNPVRIVEARIAILKRFRILGTQPGCMANIHMFTADRVFFKEEHFQAALHGLINDDSVEWLNGGRFLRLREAGYDEAHML